MTYIPGLGYVSEDETPKPLRQRTVGSLNHELSILRAHGNSDPERAAAIEEELRRRNG